jgi:hypothetical protein
MDLSLYAIMATFPLQTKYHPSNPHTRDTLTCPRNNPDVMVVQSTVTTIPGLYNLTVTLAFDLTYDLLVLLF